MALYSEHVWPVRNVPVHGSDRVPISLQIQPIKSNFVSNPSFLWFFRLYCGPLASALFPQSPAPSLSCVRPVPVVPIINLSRGCGLLLRRRWSSAVLLCQEKLSDSAQCLECLQSIWRRTCFILWLCFIPTDLLNSRASVKLGFVVALSPCHRY